MHTENLTTPQFRATTSRGKVLAAALAALALAVPVEGVHAAASPLDVQPSAATPASAAASPDSWGPAVIAWGSDGNGQSKVPVLAQSGITAISTGGLHCLALTSDGRIITWGYSNYGLATVPAEARADVSAVSAGGAHSLALTSDGRVVAWGFNAYGQTTVPDSARAGITAISAGNGHSLALTADGRVIAWGDNSSGQTTVPDAAHAGITAISAGDHHSLALTSGGRVISWGSNRSEVGTIPAGAQAGISAISAGRNHSLALTTGGRVIAWGDNHYGQTTVPDAAQAGITAISAGSASSMALTAGGRVIAWGHDDFEKVPGHAKSGVTAIAAGGGHLMALGKAPGRVFAVEGDGSAEVSWDNYVQGSLTGYVVESAPAGTQQWTFRASAGASTTSLVLSGLPNGQRLQFRVRALNGGSLLATSLASDAVVLGDPYGLRLVAGSIRSADGSPVAGVSWSSTDADGNFTAFGKSAVDGSFVFRARSTTNTTLKLSGRVTGRLTVSSGTPRVDVTLSAEPRQFQRTIIVTDKHGVPVRNATVTPHCPLSSSHNCRYYWLRHPGMPTASHPELMVPGSFYSGHAPGYGGRLFTFGGFSGSLPVGQVTGSDGVVRLRSWVDYAPGVFAKVTSNMEPGTVQQTTVYTTKLTGNDSYNQVAIAVLPFAPIMTDASATRAIAGKSVRVRSVDGISLPGVKVSLVPRLAGDTRNRPREGAAVVTATTDLKGIATFPANLVGGRYRAVPVNVSARTVDLTLPATAPAAPSNPTARPGKSRTLTVSWSAPLLDGGTAITRYIATAGGKTCTTTGRRCTITGLTNGTSYTVTIRAINAKGAGTSARVTATPRIPVTAKATKSGRTLYVDVNPDRGAASHAFRIQKRNRYGTWSTLATKYTTRGSTETRTVKLAAGTYRVWVPAYRAYGEAYSVAVGLR